MANLCQVGGGAIPRVEDHERLVVILQGSGRFVYAAGETNTISGSVLEQAFFGMVVAVGLGSGKRTAIFVGRQNNLNLQLSGSNEPGQGLETVLHIVGLW